MENVTHDIIEIMDAQILERAKKKRAEHQPKRSHYIGDYSTIYDGEFIGTCLREQVYEWWGIEPTNLEAKRAYAPAVGELLEDFIAELIKGDERVKNIDRQVEVEIKPPSLSLPIHGRADFVVTFADNYRIMYELKTVHARAMNNRKFGMKYVGAKKNYILQLSMYREYHPEPKCDEYQILVFSREDFNRMLFKGGQDFEFIPVTDFAYFQKVEEYLKKKQLPPRIQDDPDSYPCSWCKYRLRCYEVDK